MSEQGARDGANPGLGKWRAGRAKLLTIWCYVAVAVMQG